MRIVVTGGRAFYDEDLIYTALDAVHHKKGIEALCHGGATGADSIAGRWAVSRGVPVTVIKAEWDKLGNRAGLIRNREMIDQWKPDAVVAFPGNRGTAHCVARARDQGIPVWEVTIPEATIPLAKNSDELD